MTKRPLAKLGPEALLGGLSSVSESGVRHLILSNNFLHPWSELHDRCLFASQGNLTTFPAYEISTIRS